MKPINNAIALTSNGVAAYHALLAHYKGETDSRRTAAFDALTNAQQQNDEEAIAYCVRKAWKESCQPGESLGVNRGTLAT
jgi:hypothetical protein